MGDEDRHLGRDVPLVAVWLGASAPCHQDPYVFPARCTSCKSTFVPGVCPSKGGISVVLEGEVTAGDLRQVKPPVTWRNIKPTLR